MQQYIIVILIIYFSLGLLITSYLNLKNKSKAKERWIKLLFYFLILALVFFSIHIGQSQVLAIIISLIGLYEIIKVHLAIQKPNAILLGISLLYLFIVCGFLIFINKTSKENLFFLFLIVVTFDGFSQLSGQLFGRRKLAPKISPNKTYEGLFGGMLFAIFSGLMLYPFINLTLIETLAVIFIICLSSLVGDLLASWVKRIYQRKDYSNLIPGHGGVLDRFDSLIFSGATYWLIYL